MFCPKCSQRQISDEARFCSRCGFQLEGVALLLLNDGVIQNLQPAEENLSLYRQVTSRFGAKLVFLSLILAPLVFFLAVATNQPEFLLFPFILFMIGITQVGYIAIFGKRNSPAKQPKQPRSLNTSESRFKLPAPQTATVPILEIRNRDTNEMMPPSSVTDHTTKLLELNADSPESKNDSPPPRRPRI